MEYYRDAILKIVRHDLDKSEKANELFACTNATCTELWPEYHALIEDGGVMKNTADACKTMAV